jgi:hypothetical protein
METNGQRTERCDTCRFWDGETTECRRYAPVLVPALALRTPANGDEAPADAPNRGAWPRTLPDAWCGEWDSAAMPRETGDSTAAPSDVPARLFLGRIAPTLEPRNPLALLESLLNQLPPDIRRVIVRMNGLDGQPLAGLKDVAREFKISQGQIRALLAAGEERLAEAVRRLSVQRPDK